MLKLLSRKKKDEGGVNMAVNVSNRVGNVKNNRSHARNASKARQNLNLQVVEVNGVPLILRLSYSESVVLLGDRTFCCQTGD